MSSRGGLRCGLLTHCGPLCRAAPGTLWLRSSCLFRARGTARVFSRGRVAVRAADRRRPASYTLAARSGHHGRCGTVRVARCAPKALRFLARGRGRVGGGVALPGRAALPARLWQAHVGTALGWRGGPGAGCALRGEAVCMGSAGPGDLLSDSHPG
ncbi:hypothetical protein GCM10023259_031780 [Thermocatellispora tengchongensis]